MPERYCPTCGFSLQDSEVFCLQCGSEVRKLDDDTDQDVPSSPGPAQPSGRQHPSDEPPDQIDLTDPGPPPGEPPPERLRPRTDKHEWQGKLFVGFGWFGFWGTVAAGFIIGMGLASEMNVGGALLVLTLIGGLAWFQYWFIRAVRDVDRRGFYALTVLLPLAGLGYFLDSIYGSELSGAPSFVGLILILIWAHYFWRIRRKYGVGS